MRRSTVLNLPSQLVFPDVTLTAILRHFQKRIPSDIIITIVIYYCSKIGAYDSKTRYGRIYSMDLSYTRKIFTEVDLVRLGLVRLG